MDIVTIGWDGFSLQDLVSIARQGAEVHLSGGSLERMRRARRLIEKWVHEERTVYGITTGFGALSNVNISRNDARQLQENILRSHAAGVGDPFDTETVRAVMALRIKDLARGHSGIRPETVEQLVALLNAGICPVVPRRGSVGASGDLAPLAHLALALIGEGEVFYRGSRMPASSALKACRLSPVRLEAAEGLALVNGTQVMTAVGGLCVYDALRLAKHADIAAAISLEVLLGSRTEFDARDPPAKAPSWTGGQRPITWTASPVTARSSPPTRTVPGFRTLIPCGVHPRFTGPAGMLSPMPAR